MLRAVGVAARYASGYNQGYCDHYRGAVVQEVNAHAWPEVYFPGHGWIEFEPTPSQSTFVRPARPRCARRDRAPVPPPAIPEEVQTPADEEITLSPTWALTALLIVAGVYVILRPPRFPQSSRKRVPAQAVYAAYSGLLRQAAGWAGARRRPDDVRVRPLPQGRAGQGTIRPPGSTRISTSSAAPTSGCATKRAQPAPRETAPSGPTLRGGRSSACSWRALRRNPLT